eukprot:scaffold9104_cov75-Cylindrotheca_fusiformis.AAC.1
MDTIGEKFLAISVVSGSFLHAETYAERMDRAKSARSAGRSKCTLKSGRQIHMNLLRSFNGMVCAHGTCLGGAGPPNHHIGEKNRIKTTTNRNGILADQTRPFVDCYPSSFVLDAANGYYKIIQGNNIMDVSDDSRQSDSSDAEDSSEVSSQVEDFYYSKRLYRDELGKERIPD